MTRAKKKTLLATGNQLTSDAPSTHLQKAFLHVPYDGRYGRRQLLVAMIRRRARFQTFKARETISINSKPHLLAQCDIDGWQYATNEPKVRVGGSVESDPPSKMFLVSRYNDRHSTNSIPKGLHTVEETTPDHIAQITTYNIFLCFLKMKKVLCLNVSQYSRLFLIHRCQ